MRKLKSFDIAGISVQDVLDEFNERRSEFDVQDADIVSISTRSASASEIKIATPNGAKAPNVVVSIFYWIDDQS